MSASKSLATRTAGACAWRVRLALPLSSYSLEYNLVLSVFDLLTISCVVDGAVLCLHGGLSPDISTLDQLRLINRHQETPHEGMLLLTFWFAIPNS